MVYVIVILLCEPLADEATRMAPDPHNSECPLWVMNHLRDPVMGYELHIWRGGVIIFKLRREILTSPPQIQESRVILPTPSFYSSSRYAL